MARNALTPVIVTQPMGVPTDVPEDVAANLRGCSIMLRLLMAAKVHGPSDLGGTVSENVTISNDLLGLLDNAPLANFMRIKTPDMPTNLTVEICSSCRRYRFVPNGLTVPKAGPMARPGKKCKLTWGCEGQMFIAHAASIATKESDDMDEALDENDYAPDEVEA